MLICSHLSNRILIFYLRNLRNLREIFICEICVICERHPLKRVKFISMKEIDGLLVKYGVYKSQSPQTGQVYFNIGKGSSKISAKGSPSLNPLKRVKFISITKKMAFSDDDISLNPLKRVKFISMDGWAFPSFTCGFGTSQSPQTGQVYFNRPSLPEFPA